jgi:hypothetical protein
VNHWQASFRDSTAETPLLGSKLIEIQIVDRNAQTAKSLEEVSLS